MKLEFDHDDAGSTILSEDAFVENTNTVMHNHDGRELLSNPDGAFCALVVAVNSISRAIIEAQRQHILLDELALYRIITQRQLEGESVEFSQN